MGRTFALWVMIMAAIVAQTNLKAAEDGRVDWLNKYHWNLQGGEFLRAPAEGGCRFWLDNPQGRAVLASEPVKLDSVEGRQFNARFLLNSRSYAVIYLRLVFLKSPKDDSGRAIDGSGTYVSMPYDIRYPAGEYQWMRLRFEPQEGEKYVRAEIVVEKGVTDISVAEVLCGPVEPRPLSPTWACDSVSGIEPPPHYIEPEQEVVPPLTDEIRKIVRERPHRPARIEIIGGRPRMTVGGEPIAPAFYNGCWFNPHLSMFGDFHRAGVHTFLMTGSAGRNLYGTGFWTGKDTYDFTAFDHNLWRILRVDPQANIILYMGCEPYVEWGSENPDDVCSDQDGNKAIVDFHTIRFGGADPEKGQRFGPSLYSARLRRDCGNALRKLVEHLQEIEHGRAVIGIHLCGFSDGQFFDWDFGWKDKHVADYSPAGMAAFRDWLYRRYNGDLQALRQAWNDENVTFETAERPRIRQIWTDKYLVDSQQAVDHNCFASEGQAETVLALAQAVREASNGELLIGTYYEDISGNVYNHIALNRYLDSPYIDYLAGPADYRIRKGGYSGGVRNVFGSTLLHGKMFIIEQDWRSWTAGPNSPVENFAYGRAESAEEHNAMVRRESGMMLAFGLGAWWYDLAGKWFRDDGIMNGIAEAVRAFESDLPLTGLPEADAAVFLSEDSNYYNTLRNCEITRGSIAKQRVQWYTSGVPYRLYLMSDIGKVNLPKHKIYMFIDCMALNQVQRDFIESLKRDGNTLIFIGMPGIIDLDKPYHANALEGDGKRTSRQAAEQLTGIRLKDFKGRQAAYTLKNGHPLLQGVGDRLCLPLQYSSLLIDYPQDGVPVFAVNDEQAEPLATFADGENVAVAVRQFQDYRVVYSALPVLCDTLLYNLALTGGAWVTALPGDAVYANDNFITIHAMHALDGGRKTLYLHRPSRVIDLTDGSVIAENAQMIDLTMKIGETRWFRLEPVTGQ